MIDADEIDRVIDVVHEVLHVGWRPPLFEFSHSPLVFRALFLLTDLAGG